MYSHILLDLDNTIFDFEKAQLVSFIQVLKKYGVEYSEDLYKSYSEINHSLWGEYERGLISQATVQEKRFSSFFSLIGMIVKGKEANDFYQSMLSKQCWLMPHAEECCEQLSQKLTVSIVTNGVRDTQLSRINNSVIKKYISHVIISEEIGFSKPQKGFFLRTFQVIGCNDTKKILIVGDSLSSDIKGGVMAGIDTCWYNPQNNLEDSQIKSKYTIHDLRELMAIVE